MFLPTPHASNHAALRDFLIREYLSSALFLQTDDKKKPPCDGAVFCEAGKAYFAAAAM
jgi:hypothetical protein